MSAMLAGSIIELLHRHDAAFVLSKLAGVQVSRVHAYFPPPSRPARIPNRRGVLDDSGGLIFLCCMFVSNVGTADGQAFNSNFAKPDAREATGARQNFQASDFAEIVRTATESSEFLCSAMLSLPQAGIRVDAAAFGSGTP